MGSVSAVGSPFASPGCGSGTQGSSAWASTGSASIVGSASSGFPDGAAASSGGWSLAGSSRGGQLGVDGGEIVAHGSFSSVTSRPCCCWFDVALRGYAGGGVKTCVGTVRGALH